MFIIGTAASLSIIAVGLIWAYQIARKLYTLISKNHNTPQSIQITRSLQTSKEKPRIVNRVQNLEFNSSEIAFLKSDPTSCGELTKYIENQESDPTLVERLASSFPELLCPITRDLIEKPTRINSTKLHQQTKFVYEYKSIKSWIDAKKTCPMTRVKITDQQENGAQQLIPDSSYKSLLIKCILLEKLQSFETEQLPKDLSDDIFHIDPVLQYLTDHENVKTLATLEELQIEKIIDASNTKTDIQNTQK